MSQDAEPKMTPDGVEPDIGEPSLGKEGGHLIAIG